MWNSPKAKIWIAVAIWFFFIWIFQNLRFESSCFEWLRIVVPFFFPLPILVVFWAHYSFWFRKTVLSVLVSFAFFSAVAGLLTGFWFSNLLKSDEIFKQIGTYQVGSNRIQVFRTNTQGALGDFSVEILQVWPLVPGVKWVRMLHGYYGQSSLRVTHVSDNKFSYLVEPYRDLRPKASEVTITFK